MQSRWRRWAFLVPVILLVASVVVATDPAAFRGDIQSIYSMFFRGPAGEVTPVSAADPLPITGTTSVTIATITAELATGTNEIGIVRLSTNTVTLNETSRTVSLSTNTVTLAADGVVQLATNTVTLANDAQIGPDSTSVGGKTAGSLPTRPFGAQLYLTDNSGLQAWMTALTTLLADGVNGQNTAAVAPWQFNGTTWDRVRGTSSGTYVVEQPLATGSFTVLETSIVATQIASYPNRCEVSITTISTESVWIAPFGTTCSFPTGGIPLHTGDTWTGKVGPEVPIWYVSSTTGSIAVTQGVRR